MTLPNLGSGECADTCADLDEDQTRDVIAAMSRREVQPDEIIIRLVQKP